MNNSAAPSGRREKTRSIPGALSPWRRFFLHWLPLIVYCGAIFVQSSLPTIDSIPEIGQIDKVMHGTGYALLGALFMRAIGGMQRIPSLVSAVVLSILLASLYGISDEIHQYFVPSRTASVGDVAADFIGSGIGAIAYCAYIQRKKRLPEF